MTRDQESRSSKGSWRVAVAAILLGAGMGGLVSVMANNPPTAEETPFVLSPSPPFVLAGASIAFLIASVVSNRLRATTWGNPSRRFNWIVLLTAGVILVGIGVLGVLAGDHERTLPWFASGCGFLAGAVVLWRMRLP